MAPNQRIRKKKKRGLAFKLGLVAVFVCVLWTGYVQWKIWTVPNGILPDRTDVGIVLGAALWQDEPSPGLKERLDAAAALYKQGKVPRLIVSGGFDRNGSKLTEAQGMQRYLVRQGIPKEHILLENEATNTYENLLFSKRIMDKQGWKQAVIITHRYHGARAMDMAAYIGLKGAVLWGIDSKVLFTPWHEARETLAFAKWEWTKLSEPLIRSQ
jgi:uncharacterized SAM-binding protein YcdF (DUF218 family)